MQTTLPHTRPPSFSFRRRNGQLQVSLSAHPLVGLPYGRYPRLLLAWITTQAVRTRQRHLDLGSSLSSFMSELGLLPRGGRSGNIYRLREQMRRLFSVTIPWRALQSQFGCDYTRTRTFKERFVDKIRQVLVFYPEARLTIRRSGIILRPSPTHISPKSTAASLFTIDDWGGLLQR